MQHIYNGESDLLHHLAADAAFPAPDADADADAAPTTGAAGFLWQCFLCSGHACSWHSSLQYHIAWHRLHFLDACTSILPHQPHGWCVAATAETAARSLRAAAWWGRPAMAAREARSRKMPAVFGWVRPSCVW